MPSKQELLSSIQPGMKLTKNFFMRIYGYEITWPGFAEQALTELEKAGCSKARDYYQRFVSEYEQEHEKAMKNVAEWYRKQNEKKGSEGVRKQQEVEQLTKKSQLLKKKLQLLKQKKTEQSQLVTMEKQDQ
ncbi:MAG: hypothetical protein IJZ53_11050 [Tyzzerella sp.]|nr:hypothetical protein [Tyzzerella sp.]